MLARIVHAPEPLTFPHPLATLSLSSNIGGRLKRFLVAAATAVIASSVLAAPAHAATSIDPSFDPPQWQNGCTGTYAASPDLAAAYPLEVDEAFTQIGSKTGIHFQRLGDGDQSAHIYLSLHPHMSDNDGMVGLATIPSLRIELESPDLLYKFPTTTAAKARLDYQVRRNLVMHEVLHTLGSPHSDESGSMMHPSITAYSFFGSFELGQMADVAKVNGCAPYEVTASPAMQQAEESMAALERMRAAEASRQAKIQQCTATGLVYNSATGACAVLKFASPGKPVKKPARGAKKP